MEKSLEGPGRAPRIVQVMYFKQVPRQLNQQPEVGLPQQWEAQWQEFLNTLQPARNLQLTDMAPWDDAQAFLMAFEQVAEACQWPREEWVRQLLPALRGGMEQAFCILEARERSDYAKVKAAILRADALRMEMKRQHFRQCSYQELEGPRRVYSQLQDLCRQWLKPESHTKEQILEMIIQEQLLGMLPAEAQSWVRECGPKDCIEVVALAEEFLMGPRHAPRTCDWQVPLPEVSVSSLEPEGRQRQHCHPGASEMTPTRNTAHPSSAGLEMPEAGTTEGPVHVKEELDLDQKPIHWEVMRGSGSSSSALEGLLVPTPEVNSQTDQPQPTFQERPEHGDQIPDAQFGGEESRSTRLQQQNIKLEDEAGACLPHDDQLSPAVSQEEGRTANEASGHRDTRVHACTKCGYQAEKLLDILKHFRVHNNKEKPYRYLDCGNSFGWSSTLMKHPQTHIASQQTPVPNAVIAECDVTLSDDEELINSLAKKPPRQAGLQNGPKRASKRGPAAVPPSSAAFRLEASSLPFRSKGPNGKGKSVPRRVTVMASKKSRYEGMEKKHVCLDCGHRTYYLSDLMRHKRAHPNGKPYKCPDCEIIFVQPSFLKCHMKTHKTEGKRMKSLKAPQGERKHTCSKCGHKTYKLSTHLLHMRAHVVERETSYICEECGKDFKRLNNFTRHMRIHNFNNSKEGFKIRRPSFTQDKEINRSYEEPKKNAQVHLKKIGRPPASTASNMVALRKHWRNYKCQQRKKAAEKLQKMEERAKKMKENIGEKKMKENIGEKETKENVGENETKENIREKETKENIREKEMKENIGEKETENIGEKEAKENNGEKETKEKSTPELSLRARLEKFAYSKNRGNVDSQKEQAPDSKVSAKMLEHKCTMCGHNTAHLADHPYVRTDMNPYRCTKCLK